MDDLMIVRPGGFCVLPAARVLAPAARAPLRLRREHVRVAIGADPVVLEVEPGGVR
jgi:hypothetical protein